MPGSSSDAAGLVVALCGAAKAMDVDAAEGLARRLVALVGERPAALAPGDAWKAAKSLRRKRMFPPLERFLEAYLLHAADPNPLLRTVHAQALVDQGRLEAARALLQDLLREVPAEPPPGSPWPKAAEEARGLVGRVHKQAFVALGAASPQGQAALRLAIEAYADAFARAEAERAARPDADPFWPGVNLVALTLRARADGVKVPEPREPVALARELLARAARRLDDDLQAAAAKGEEPEDRPWLVATALEASLALGDEDATVAWGKRYLACRSADAFELASTHRQLTEIWRLHARGGIAAAFVPILEGELLRNRPGALVDGAVGAQTVTVGAEQQAVWGNERFQNYVWVLRAVRNAGSVAQVRDVNGRAVGTGFLLRGEELSPAWAGKTVFLTNRHVIDSEAPAQGVSCARARVHFTAASKAPPDGFAVVPKPLWRSIAAADAALDCVVLELVPARDERGEAVAPPAATIEVGDRASLQPGGDGARIYIIGHPGGQALSYSLYDNALVTMEPPLVYYRSPTLGGSSGSPVFDPDWRLVAIHHSHVPAKTANCGTFIDAIRDAIAKA